MAANIRSHYPIITSLCSRKCRNAIRSWKSLFICCHFSLVNVKNRSGKKSELVCADSAFFSNSHSDCCWHTSSFIQTSFISCASFRVYIKKQGVNHEALSHLWRFFIQEKFKLSRCFQNASVLHSCETSSSVTFIRVPSRLQVWQTSSLYKARYICNLQRFGTARYPLMHFTWQATVGHTWKGRLRSTNSYIIIKKVKTPESMIAPSGLAWYCRNGMCFNNI